MIVLQVNFVGAIEFDKQADLVLRGAVRVARPVHHARRRDGPARSRSATTPNFVLSVGGFHPRFTPPPLPFPSPQRHRDQHRQRRRSRASASRATSRSRRNTVQFGARAEAVLRASTRSASQGHLGFDALFQFSPFYFIVEISASFSVKVFGVGRVQRPTCAARSRARRRGTSHGDGLDRRSCSSTISRRLRRDVGREPRTPRCRRSRCCPLLEAELEQGRELARAAAAERQPARVAARAAGGAGGARAAPARRRCGSASARLPLDLTLDKVGNQKPTRRQAPRASRSPAAGLGKAGDAREQFAPAQFRDLDDAAKLSRPAFEPRAWRPRRCPPAGAEVALEPARAADRPLRGDHHRHRLQAAPAPVRALRLGAVRRSSWPATRRPRRRLVRAARSAAAAVRRRRSPSADETYTVAFQANNQAYAADAACRSPARRARASTCSRRWPPTPTLAEHAPRDPRRSRVAA